MTQTNQNTESVITEPNQQLKYSQQDWIASRGVRAVVYVLDSLILLLLVSPIIFLFDNVLAKFGIWTVLAGVVIQVLYFGIQNSHIRQGQTFAKKLLNIRVLDINNQYLSLGKSCFRALILALPFALQDLTLPFEPPLLWYLVSVIVFGGFLSIIYLLLFNKGTKQNLHDLLIGSYVVNVKAKPESKLTKTINKKHLFVVVVLFILALLAPAMVNKSIENNPETAAQLEQMESIVSNVDALPEVVETNVSYGYTTYRSFTGDVDNESESLPQEPVANEKHILTVQVRVADDELVNNDTFEQKIATIAKEQAGLTMAAFDKGIDEIHIRINHGYSFAFFSTSSSSVEGFNYGDLSRIE